ncbi:MAG: hypothetical protein AB1641_26270 [Thermodesulfobacteriota bacterium]
MNSKPDNLALLLFLKNFRVLLSGGHNPAAALELMAAGAGGVHLRSHFTRAGQALTSGRSLAEALFDRKHPWPAGLGRCLKDLEAAAHPLENIFGFLEEAYAARARYYQPSDWRTYFLLVGQGLVALAVWLFLTGFVAPAFADMYTSFGARLPFLTQAFIDLTNLVRHHFLATTLVGIALILVLPLLVFKTSNPGFVFAVLRAGLDRGLNLGQGLAAAAALTENPWLRRRVLAGLKGLDPSRNPAQALAASGLFPKFAAGLLAQGQGAVAEIAAYYEARAVKVRIVELVGAGLFITLICLAVAFLIAIYLPLFQMAGVVS